MSRSPASPGTGKQHKTAQDIRQIVFDTFGPWPHVSPWAKLSIRNAGNSWKLSIRNGDVTKKNGGSSYDFTSILGMMYRKLAFLIVKLIQSPFCFIKTILLVGGLEHF